MTFCLILMVLPNGLDIRPTVEEWASSIATTPDAQLIWKADASQTSAPPSPLPELRPAWPSSAIGQHTLAKDRPWQSAGLRLGGAHLRVHRLCKQHSIIDVFCGLAVAFIWWMVYLRPGSVELFGKIYSFLLPLLLTAQMPAGTMVVADISHFRALPVSEGA